MGAALSGYSIGFLGINVSKKSEGLGLGNLEELIVLEELFIVAECFPFVVKFRVWHFSGGDNITLYRCDITLGALLHRTP